MLNHICTTFCTTPEEGSIRYEPGGADTWSASYPDLLLDFFSSLDVR